MSKSNKFLALLISFVLLASCLTAFGESFDTENITIGGGGKTTTTTTTTTTDDFNTDSVPLGCTTHSWDSGKVTKKATTSANGTILYSCTKCVATKTSTINKIGAVKLSTTSFVYNGKTKTPVITVKNSKGNKINSKYYTVTIPTGRKNVGKYTYKVKFKTRYSGSKSVSFTIKPTATSIASLTAGSNKFTVKWAKKTTQVTGYQIRYSTNSSFKDAKTLLVKSNKTTSKTISSLKAKKKYYVQVRTYKIVNSTKYYSSWSSTKSVTTK